MRKQSYWVFASIALSGLIWAVAQTQLPEGPGKSLVEQKCAICHGLEVTVNQRLSATDWDFLVGQMINNGAPVSPEERKVIVEYLATNFGPSSSSAQQAPAASASAQAYAACQGCHQANGAGVPGAFPPLVKHVADILNTKGGREYLPLVIVNGLQGSIRVGGVNYSTPMPGFSSLSDAQLVAVLNYIATAWGNDKLLKDFKPYTESEIKGLRKQLSPQQVLAERAKLSLP
ncbi:c-type cytochrome [Meiothermus sp.]|uniref:c-type cytochrome n=1 Tax=Meiothermus sp. TaxID=1955249 RepID=UPI0021DB97EB|nr:c-type cytochrome [Meiothermus sp.]GIW25106.1 MAG: cytochrome c552 [Meiothermus sp.]